MAGTVRGITIEIEGKTSGLVKSLDSVNGQLKDTQNQLKTVNQALKLDPSNVEAIAAKQDLLKTAISQTKEKLELEKQAAADAAEALKNGTITQNEYNTLQAAVAKTSAELNALEAEAGQAGSQMDNLGEETKEAADEAEKSGSKFEGFGSAVAAGAAAAAAAIAAVSAAAIAAGKALIDCAVGGAQFADDILTLSSVTGVSAETLQEWSYAAELVDVSVDTMAGALQKTTRAMSSARDGSGAAAEAFAQLGISATDSNGNLRDNEQVFWEIIDALGNVENETERDALAMELLGKSATELNPLIEAGSAQMEEYAEMAHDAGYVLDGETLDAFGDFDNTLQQLNAGTTAAKNALGTVLLPVLNDLAGEGVSLLGEFSNAMLDANGDVDQMAAVFGEMIPRVVDTVFEYLPMVLELAGTIISALADGIIENLPMILETAVEIIVSIANGLVEALPELIPTVVDLILLIVETLIDNLPMIIDSAIQVIVAVAQGMTSALPRLIPVTVAAISQIITGLLDHIPEIIVCAIDLMIALATGLVDAIPDIVSRIPEIIAAILGAFSNLGSELSENASRWGSDMINGLVNSIRNAISSVASAASDVAATIASYLHFSVPDIGPLSDADEYGGDFMELLSEGIDENIGKIKASVNDVALTMDAGINSVDYSGTLNGISNQLASLAGDGQAINIYIGSERIGTAMLQANSRMALISGGF